MNKNGNPDKFEVIAVGLVLGVIVIAILVAIGPSGCERSVSAWKASAYGSDWLVIQYAQDGSVINCWELRNRSIGNEERSDGIYFKDNDGNVIHLSGHYVYVQTADFDEARKKYIHQKEGAQDER